MNFQPNLRWLLAGLCAMLCFQGPAFGAVATKQADAADRAFFERRIRPIFVKHCYECHSQKAEKLKGNLRLDHAAGWLEGGDTGKAIVPGNPTASLLLTAVRRTDADLQMPPKHTLAAASVRLLEQWIKRGAPGPKNAPSMATGAASETDDADRPASIADRAKTHWAYLPVITTEPPQSTDAAWNKNPIDQFVNAQLKNKKLQHAKRATPRTLIRRLSYDLTGLPPSPEKVTDFVDDFEYARVEKLVDRLIDSQAFGEHFARLWLDVARYADTANSYRPDTKTPHYYPYAFTYRDYVVEAFNEDKPFDQFVREQLAADLMDFGPNAPQLAALGFIGVSPHRGMSDDFVDDVIDTTTRGLLGMTVACARCHDHKFEPVPTADYYSLFGVFSSVNRPAQRLLNQYPLIEGYTPSSTLQADYQKARDIIDADIAKVGKQTKGGNKLSRAQEIEETDLAKLLTTHNGAPTRAMSVSESKKPVNPVIYLRGDRASRGEAVPRRFLKVLDPQQLPFNKNNSGRLDLANKIVDPQNPLAARVFVNRIWGALIGNHLVSTPSDFGLEGAPPTHPQLLDWLAADFVAHGWSLKHLVRQIVTSQTYQQRSDMLPKLAEIDPENKWLARANAKRLSFENLRDSVLIISGKLDTHMRGRSEELWGTTYTKRRSIYGFLNRFNLDPTLRSFDFPSPVQTQGKRTESIVPPQSLFTMNSPFVIDQSKQLIARLNFTSQTNRSERIDLVFQAVLQRDAHEVERERVGRFVDFQSNRSPNPWPLVAQALIMSNEFLYLD